MCIIMISNYNEIGISYCAYVLMLLCTTLGVTSQH